MISQADAPAISLRNAALRYAEMGYRVFPCKPHGKAPVTSNGCHAATCDLDQIEAWWSATPTANVAIATDGLLVVDLDPGADDELGNRCCAETRVVATTPRGGMHAWYRQPAGAGLRNTAGRLGEHVDTRADGGYVVVAPSRVVDEAKGIDGAYAWVGEPVPPEDLPEPPQWLLTMASKPKAGGRESIPSGQRNTKLASIAGRWRHDGCDADEITAALRRRNAKQCEPPLDDSEVRQIAGSISRYAPGAAIAFPENQTDLANARRLVAAHGDKLRYCHPWGKWLTWDGCRWKLDDDGAVMRLAKSIADQVWSEARQAGENSAMRHAARTASDKGARAMLSLAASDLPVLPAELDANPMLLNFQNGTVDLRTGELRGHRREDSITKLCVVEFDPAAAAPTWERFLQDVFAGADDVIPFLQRYLGYCATGDVREQILAVFHGGGSNGKSTLLEGVSAALGPDYAAAAPRDLLMAKRGESHPTELADLHGKRFVVAQETENNRTLAEGLVKQLTGGDTIKARRMREDFWQFAPSHKIVLCTNHRPRVRGTDHAIWRRLRLVPFNIRFDGDRKDKTMPAKLAAERQGILAWIVRGAVAWHQHGLSDPPTVLAATAEYRSESDTIGRFIAENCIVNAECRVKFADFHEALTRACEEQGESIPPKRITSEYLSERYKRLMNNGLWFKGLGLQATE